MSYSSERVKDYRERIKTLIVKSMGGKCQCCGYDRCNNALELHHINPNEKEFGFGVLRANPKRKLDLVTELKKCVLLCSNCHKEVHAGTTNLPERFTSLDESIFLEKEMRASRPKIKKERPRKITMTPSELANILVNQYDGNKSALARYYNVSEAAIRKHLKYNA